MKKLLLIPALLGTMAMAQNYKYELSPMIGYNLAEGNLGLDNDGYFTGGLEFQINSEDTRISPEFSLYYAPSADYATSGSTDIIRGAFNAVYTYDKVDTFTPFAKAGLGIENFTTNKEGNDDRLFLDAGIGAKMSFTENLALKLEAIYMLKPSSSHAGNADSNLMTLVGLTYSFGEQAQKEFAPKEEVVEIQEVIVVVPLVDSDGDGIVDADDKCANTPSNTTVGITGCAVAQDDDHDGVFNAQDICPNTPANSAVDENGCPAIIALDIKFENNSYKVKSESYSNIKRYADFLKKYTNYSAKIVGYTDSVGRASYNQTLSEKRAKEVVKMLMAEGVKASQLSSKGMGEANPVADNATAEGRAQNRRIEAELIHN